MSVAKRLIANVLHGLPADTAILFEEDQPQQPSQRLRILVIDHILMFGLSIAQKLELDGHEVVYATVWGPESASPYVDFLGRGNHIKLDPEGWMNHLEWANLVVVTGSEHRGHVVDFLRKQGLKVAGPDSRAVQLELSRQIGWEAARAAGIQVPWQQRFTSLDQLRQYVEDNPKPYVLKLDQTVRDAGETLVGQDPNGADLLASLNRLAVKLDFANGAIGYYLQQLLSGTEVSVGGWFNGQEIIGDRLLVSYDAVGGFVYDLRVDGAKLINKDKLIAFLRVLNHRGPFDINGMVNDQGQFVFLEWTPRWGSGVTEFFCYSVPDLGNMLWSAANSEQYQLIKPELAEQIVVLVNARDEDSDGSTILNVSVPEGSRLPYITAEAALWSDNAVQTTAGKWVVLPIQQDERRKARYVAHGATIQEAIAKIEKLAKVAYVCDASVETARLQYELTERVDKIYQLLNK